MLHAHTLAEWARGSWTALPTRPIEGVHFDSRLLKPNHLFVALKTQKNDGHRYLAEALAKGASAALVERVDRAVPLPQLEVSNSLKAFQSLAKQHRKAFQCPLVGITGSHGKTSTKDALALLLEEHSPLKTELNFNNTLGLPYTLLQLDAKLHHLAVIEAGISLFGEMDTLADMLQPDAVIVTNIFGQHLEGLKTIENVALEKSKLVQALKPGGLFVTTPSAMAFDCFRSIPNTIVVCPKDSIHDKSLSSLKNQNLSIRSYEERVDPKTACTYIRLEGYPEWQFPLVSRGILQNLVLASVVALELGLNPADLQKRIASWQPSPERGEWIRRGDQVYYADCYNSGPAALVDALKYFKARVGTHQPCLYVLGAMHELGEASEALHYNLGKSFTPQEKDQFLLIGSPAKPLQQGLLDQGVSQHQITYLEHTDGAKAALERFQGAIFLKGSHGYRLNSLLPASGRISDN